jgi:arylsulfatase A
MKTCFLIAIFCAATFMLSACTSNSAKRSGAKYKKPNIVLIMADDIGIEGLGCYGGQSYNTPALDKLASQGIRFTHAYAQPLCSNTRIQLMTGLFNNRNWLAFGLLEPKAKTIGHYMKDAGYKTCIAGKWQLQSYDPPDYPGAATRRGKGMHPKDAGFDEYSLFHSLNTEDKGSRYADPTYLENGVLRKEMQDKYGPDMWVDYISGYMERNRNEPFFVYYSMALPHWPMVPTPNSADWKDAANRNEPDTRHFKDMVEYMDHCVDRIVKKIDALGLAENTLVIFYSDNGTHLKITSQTKAGPVAGGKGWSTDAGTHVPMIARWPGVIQAGVNDDLIDSTDFIPTLLEAAGKPLPAKAKLDGRSFYPRLVGKPGNPRPWIYCYYDPRPGWDKDQFSRLVFARDKRYKLYEDGRLFDVPSDVLEKKPIMSAADTAETEAVRARLAAVLQAQK